MDIKDNQGELYEVFIQRKPGADYKHAGNLHAYDKKLALENARDLYTRRNEGTAIWVVQSKHIIASQTSDSESFFDPADDKIYRHPTFYIMPEGVKNI
ncbi:MAG: 1,2-phenylacetyl-CoA epoxidase subunit PaaB [Saprospiraceae bacterium]